MSNKLVFSAGVVTGIAVTFTTLVGTTLYFARKAGKAIGKVMDEAGDELRKNMKEAATEATPAVEA